MPSIVLLGADDGVGPPPATDTDARHFTGPYRREIVAGVGHNFPQEAPATFAEAVRALLCDGAGARRFGVAFGKPLAIVRALFDRSAHAENRRQARSPFAGDAR